MKYTTENYEVEQVKVFFRDFTVEQEDMQDLAADMKGRVMNAYIVTSEGETHYRVMNKPHGQKRSVFFTNSFQVNDEYSTIDAVIVDESNFDSIGLTKEQQDDFVNFSITQHNSGEHDEEFQKIINDLDDQYSARELFEEMVKGMNVVEPIVNAYNDLSKDNMKEPEVYIETDRAVRDINTFYETRDKEYLLSAIVSLTKLYGKC